VVGAGRGQDGIGQRAAAGVAVQLLEHPQARAGIRWHLRQAHFLPGTGALAGFAHVLGQADFTV
jgi:hypothetical protein